MEKFNFSLPKSYFRYANIVLLVYRTDDVRTYKELAVWYFHLSQELDLSNVKIILIGNIFSSKERKTITTPIPDEYFSFDHHILFDFQNVQLTLLLSCLQEMNVNEETKENKLSHTRIRLEMEYDENLNYKLGGPCCAGAYRSKVIGKRKENGKLEEYIRY